VEKTYKIWGVMSIVQSELDKMLDNHNITQDYYDYLVNESLKEVLK